MRLSNTWLPGTLCAICALVIMSRSGDDDLLARHHRGLTLLYQREFTAAEAEFLAVARRTPGDATPWINLAVSQLNQAEKGVHRAIASLLRARELAADAPRVPYCLGIIYRFLGRTEDAKRELQLALRLAPDDPDVHYQFALILLHGDQPELALGHLEAAKTRDPRIIGVWNNLYQVYRRLGREEDALEAARVFQMLKSTRRGSPRGLRFTEMGALAEGIADWAPYPGQVEAMLPIRFAAPVELPARGPFTFVDHDLDGVAELWCAGSRPGIWDLSEASPRLAQPLEVLRDATSFAVADFDEDGRPDLVTGVEGRGVITYVAAGDGTRFEPGQILGGERTEVRLADVDLEGDLDIIATGDGETLAFGINRGRKFADFAGPPAPLEELGYGVRLLLVRDLDRDGDAELVVATPHGARLVDNGPQWRFVIEATRTLPELGVVRSVTAGDLDGDGDEDLVVCGERPGICWNDGHGHFPELAPLDELVGAGATAIADLDLDGHPDLLVAGQERTLLLRNRGAAPGASGVRPRFRVSLIPLPPMAALVTADVDGDLDLDVGYRTPEGDIGFIRNTSRLPHGVLGLHLGGKRDGADRRTNLLGIGARVEVRSGNLVATATHVGPVGAGAQGITPLVFGLGRRSRVESLLISWPDGVVQSESKLPLGSYQVVEEVQRKSSSCPILFTWDGEQYRFITDFMGGGGLGFWMGIDRYGAPDPTETVRIPPDALSPIDGELRVSVMEPMEEVCFVDALALRVVDHPAGLEIYPDEMFSTSGQSPTGRALAIITAERAFPERGLDGSGHDVTRALLTVDRRYPSNWSLHPDRVGYAEPHRITLRFGADLPRTGDVRLFLDGWVEYPYSRVNFAAHQDGARLSSPTFHWRRGPDDSWRLLGEEIGYPAGMPKTMVLDISAAAAAGLRELRIDTDMELYWDRIFAARIESGPAVTERTLKPRRAVLRFGGYPRELSDDGSLPPTYHYRKRDLHIPYKRMSGGLTRRGEVRELCLQVDDRFVILGGGDELLLAFDGTALPPLAPGFARTYLLDTHGYCKDMDPLTAERTSVEPLPFGAMGTYPPSRPRPVSPEPGRSSDR